MGDLAIVIAYPCYLPIAHNSAVLNHPAGAWWIDEINTTDDLLSPATSYGVVGTVEITTNGIANTIINGVGCDAASPYNHILTSEFPRKSAPLLAVFAETRLVSWEAMTIGETSMTAKADLKKILSRTLKPADAPLAAAIEQNVAIYDCTALAAALDDGEGIVALKQELAANLLHGSGVFVLKGAYENLQVLDDATQLF